MFSSFTESYYARYLIKNNMSKEPAILTCRYEESAGDARLQIWGQHTNNGETVRTYSGPVETMPEWMRAVRDVAMVGGHMPPNPNPPPNYILWFKTDPQFNLQEFVTNVPT